MKYFCCVSLSDDLGVKQHTPINGLIQTPLAKSHMTVELSDIFLSFFHNFSDRQLNLSLCKFCP